MMRLSRRATLTLSLVGVALLAALGVDVSVHEYAGSGFAPRANSFPKNTMQHVHACMLSGAYLHRPD
jgi:hypothetical protein